MQPGSTSTSAARIHPFDTAAGEAIFKALLWVVVILQAILLGREYNQRNHQTHRATAAAPTASRHQPR